MVSQPDLSISQWIVGAQEGDSRAVSALWQCYFERLVRLARGKLAGVSRRAADEEDVALSAFASFCRAAKGGRIPDLADRDGLWRLLIKLTAQKAVDRRRHDGCAKRGGGRVRGESALAHREASESGDGFDRVIGDAPTPTRLGRGLRPAWHSRHDDAGPRLSAPSA